VSPIRCSVHMASALEGGKVLSAARLSSIALLIACKTLKVESTYLRNSVSYPALLCEAFVVAFNTVQYESPRWANAKPFDPLRCAFPILRSAYMFLLFEIYASGSKAICKRVVCKWCLPFYAFSISCKDRSLAAPDLSLKPLSRSSEVTSQSLTVYKMPPSSICNSILTCSAIRNHTPPHLPISIATWRSSRLINPRRLPRNQSKPQ
jgi:hypothetical protein